MKIKFIPLDYSSVPQSDSVVILCGGPSIQSYAKKVRKYIRDNNSITISANYDYSFLNIYTNYTYITDTYKLLEILGSLKTTLIIPAEPKTDRLYKQIVSFKMRLHKGRVGSLIKATFKGPEKVLVAGTKDVSETVYSSKGAPHDIKINEDGTFPYRRFGSAGQGATILSLVFRPKKILIVGLDGPSASDITHKYMYDGTLVKYGDKSKFRSAKRYIQNVLIPSVLSKGVEIETFQHVRFYGISRHKMGIKVLG